jgi:hypothetical protein
MPRRLPPGCVEDRDRHGNVRVYYRGKGRPKVRLRGTPWTTEFMAEYDAAKSAAAVPFSRLGAATGTGAGFASDISVKVQNTNALIHRHNTSVAKSWKAHLMNPYRRVQRSSSVTCP